MPEYQVNGRKPFLATFPAGPKNANGAANAHTAVRFYESAEQALADKPDGWPMTTAREMTRQEWTAYLSK